MGLCLGLTPPPRVEDVEVGISSPVMMLLGVLGCVLGRGRGRGRGVVSPAEPLLSEWRADSGWWEAPERPTVLASGLDSSLCRSLLPSVMERVKEESSA